MDPHPTVDCELCGLRHRATAVLCDRCEHQLGTQPDVAALRAEVTHLKQTMMLGALAFAAMLALNVAVFGGGAYIVLVAPVGWIIFSAYRLRVLSAWLRHHQTHRPDIGG